MQAAAWGCMCVQARVLRECPRADGHVCAIIAYVCASMCACVSKILTKYTGFVVCEWL